MRTSLKNTAAILVALLAISVSASECWEVRMVLDVPRVLDNSSSLGYRKYQTQKIRGFFTVDHRENEEPEIVFCSMENLTHKVGGRNVNYDVTVDGVKWHGIGSNLKDEFPIRSCVITITAEPSYAIGEEPTEDNSIIITLSGKGKEGFLNGYASGQVGCGCAEYGHKSPTRIWGTGTVVDTAAVYGKFKAKRVR